MSLFDARWPRWIKASVFDSFRVLNAAGPNYVFYVEGQERLTNQAGTWMEMRLDGPFERELSKDYFELYVDVDVLVSSQMDEDVYLQDRMIGDVMAMFVNSIPVFEFGDSPSTQIGCLRLDTTPRQGLRPRQFGQIEPKIKLFQSSILGRYIINLP